MLSTIRTPRQMQILQALGAQVPAYAHVPMILGPDKQKLSKRLWSPDGDRQCLDTY